MAAGFIPQLFSVVFANREVVWDLLSHSGAKALGFDHTFLEAVADSPLKSMSTIEVPEILWSDTAMIVHSSGTTSGMPKLIPATHGWLTAFVQIKYPFTIGQGSMEGENVISLLGSLAHVGSFCGGLVPFLRLGR